MKGGAQTRLAQQVEHVVVRGLHLHVVGLRGLVLLLRDGAVFEQPPNALQVGARLLEGRAAGIDLQPHVARVQLGKQLAAPHLLPLRHGDRKELSRELEGQIDGIVGGGQTDEIAVDEGRITCRLGLDRTHGIGRGDVAAAAAAQQRHEAEEEQ